MRDKLVLQRGVVSLGWRAFEQSCAPTKTWERAHCRCEPETGGAPCEYCVGYAALRAGDKLGEMVFDAANTLDAIRREVEAGHSYKLATRIRDILNELEKKHVIRNPDTVDTDLVEGSQT